MTESTTISFRVKNNKLKWQLKKTAAEQQTTLGELIERLLTESLNRLNEAQEGGSNDQQSA